MSRAGCGNCGAALTGPYCAECGQHAHESARAIGTLFHDAWHVVTHVDGRFWRTLGTLLLRPGVLTQQYFAERRARYLPPVRLYLVLSVLFFAVPSPGDEAATARTQAAAARAEAALKDDPAAAAELAAVREKVAAALASQRAGARPAAAASDAAGGSFGFDGADCAGLRTSPKWLEEPLRRACVRSVADRGQALKRAVVANIPKMMFVFLPIMALVMLLLYWWPRHYYVEHLVFFLHTHAALFLLLLLSQGLEWLARGLPALATAASVARFLGLAYAVWYVYRALRVYYAQRRWLTLAKLTLVGFAYFTCLLITLLGTVVISALTT